LGLSVPAALPAKLKQGGEGVNLIILRGFEAERIQGLGRTKIVLIRVKR